MKVLKETRFALAGHYTRDPVARKVARKLPKRVSWSVLRPQTESEK